MKKIFLVTFLMILLFSFEDKIYADDTCSYTYYQTIDSETSAVEKKNDQIKITASYTSKKFSLNGGPGGKEDLMNWTKENILPKVKNDECPKFLYHIEDESSWADSQYFGSNVNYQSMYIFYKFVLNKTFSKTEDISVYKLDGYEAKEPSNGDLIGACVYDGKGIDETQYIYFFINDKFDIELSIYGDKSIIINNNEDKLKDKMIYDNFMKDDKIDCSNFSNRVYYSSTIANGSTTHERRLDIENFNGSTEYKLNTEKSVIFTVTPDIDKKDDEDISKVCHYGSIVLYLYKDNTYDTNIPEKDGEHKNYVTLSSDYKIEYGYCPNYLCKKTYIYQGEGGISYLFSETEPSICDKIWFPTVHDDDLFNCGIIQKYYDSSIEYLDEYNENKDIDSYKNYEKQKKKIQDFCSIALQNLDYDSPDKCVQNCFTAIDMLKNYEGGFAKGQCGFSEKLIKWIANIIKWVKYIVPVIVIVMGILDFIKALSSGKDDEMKKAQGHFIKRLIAAALIFITPFIIEFILDKMGFAANGCGIIDL